MATLRGTVLFAVFALSSAYLHVSVYDYLATLPNVSRFVSLVNQAGLDGLLRSKGPFTVLVPTNDAFNKFSNYRLVWILRHPTVLKRMMQYHVVNATLITPLLHNGRIVTSFDGHNMRVFVDHHKYYFNQALVVKRDTIVANGVIQLIDAVLEYHSGTILQQLSLPANNASIFFDYVNRTGLGPLLGTVGHNRYTVFAPTDAAFMALGSDTRTYFETHSSDLKKLVQYHIHSGIMREESLNGTNGAISTLDTGHNIQLAAESGSGAALLDQTARIIISDIETENGVVHVISNVLIPSEFTSIVG